MPWADRQMRLDYHKAYYRRNAEKQKASRRAYYKANKVRIAKEMRAYTLKRNYGLTPEQYAEMLRSQDGKCAICMTKKPGGRGDFHVDHCHTTGRVRGLLCVKCNMALGWVERFSNVANGYLTRGSNG